MVIKELLSSGYIIILSSGLADTKLTLDYYTLGLSYNPNVH